MHTNAYIYIYNYFSSAQIDRRIPKVFVYLSKFIKLINKSVKHIDRDKAVKLAPSR